VKAGGKQGLIVTFFYIEDGSEMFSEIPVEFQRSTPCYASEGRPLHNHLCENLKSYFLSEVAPRISGFFRIKYGMGSLDWAKTVFFQILSNSSSIQHTTINGVQSSYLQPREITKNKLWLSLFPVSDDGILKNIGYLNLSIEEKIS
jgi:hypothetical protein